MIETVVSSEQSGIARTFVFTFGSNQAGRHGAGAALRARQAYGAIYGQGEGHQGESYAIPTKDRALRSLSLAAIQGGVERFLTYAREHPELSFGVTRIGCGLAGYKDAQIAPFFAEAPDNCLLPEGWREWGENSHDPLRE